MKSRLAHPEIVVALAAALWGLFWIPLRAFEIAGFEAGWLTLAQFVAPLVILLPFALVKIGKGESCGLKQWSTGILIGSAFALYCESLLLTDVVRALVLFYVMPAWGTLVEVLILKRKFTLWRGVALILSLTGLIIILNIGTSFSISINTGDVMALASGIVFTFGAMRVRQNPEVAIFDQIFAFFFYGGLFALALSLIPIGGAKFLPDLSTLMRLIPWFALMALGFLIPIMWGLYWGSRYVDPGRLGILLQLEAVVGISSAALFAGEPFGWREAAGALFVISAGLVEVLGNKPARSESVFKTST